MIAMPPVLTPKHVIFFLMNTGSVSATICDVNEILSQMLVAGKVAGNLDLELTPSGFVVNAMITTNHIGGFDIITTKTSVGLYEDRDCIFYVLKSGNISFSGQSSNQGKARELYCKVIDQLLAT